MQLLNEMGGVELVEYETPPSIVVSTGSGVVSDEKLTLMKLPPKLPTLVVTEPPAASSR